MEKSIGTVTIAESNYWASEISGLIDSAYGTRKNIEDMYNKNEYESLDFDNIWLIEEGTTIPYLKDMDKPENVNKENIHKNEEIITEVATDNSNVTLNYKSTKEVVNASIDGENIEIVRDNEGNYTFSKVLTENKKYELTINRADELERKIEYLNDDLLNIGEEVNIFNNINTLSTNLYKYSFIPTWNTCQNTRFEPGIMEGGHYSHKASWSAYFNWNYEKLKYIMADELDVEFYQYADKDSAWTSSVACGVIVNYSDGTQDSKNTSTNAGGWRKKCFTKYTFR